MSNLSKNYRGASSCRAPTSSQLTNKKIIIGVGNPFRRDDGIGIAVIEQLRLQKSTAFDIYDGGTDGLALLDVVGQYSEAIIIDAVNMGADPGCVKVFVPAEALIQIKNEALSTHGFGLAEMLKFCELLNIHTNIRIIGIQPKDIDFGEGLSDEVRAAIPTILSLINSNQ